MDTILNSGSPLLADFIDLKFLILILGICLATLVARNLIERSDFLTGDSVWAKFLRMIHGMPNRSSLDDVKHRDVLGQLRERLPAAPDIRPEEETSIVDLLSQIVDVNATLHTRLESAEGTLEDQVAEITAYKSEARTDAMTGLANRRVFDELLRDRLNDWQRDGVPVSVLLVDIDHFKRFNDDYGHLAGDEVLTQVARLLSDSMGEGDLVSRIGGEEFSVIIDADGPQTAQTRAEHARQEIEQADFVYEDQPLHVTVSIGVADSQGAENASSLVKRVDVALYASKAAGRNIVHWHDGEQSIPLTARRANVNPVSGFATTGVAALTETKDFGTVCHELRQRLVAVASEEI